MAPRDLALGMVFLVQTLAGILGNSSLLLHYLILYFTGCKFRLTDLILKHLTVANVLVILSKGVPQTMAALGMKHFLDDTGCKLVFYVHRVSRDVSIGSTCLLSVFQAITISPTCSRWMGLKVKAPKYVGPSTILCWSLNLMLNVMVPVHVTARWQNNNITRKMDYDYCSAMPRGKITESLYIALMLFRDVVFVGLMLWASSFMVFILYRHKQQVQYIHALSHTSSPGSRATQSILVLVSTFVLCSLSSFLHIGLAFLNIHETSEVKVSTLIAGCFPAISPYILMSYDSRVPTHCLPWIIAAKSSVL
ncbi:vomeronasal 1 receptor oryCunV1R1559 [Oryctolagus cuniculus]|uniref:Vomeronasal type-1 receptor n=1 Tax=Oryctolagus cuniculus TaxID=9986 RepID=G1TSW4_RABIT|nr:vomeronasal 1 receptor oryCunV1R1559 [Oryctolagus cuniculus]